MLYGARQKSKHNNNINIKTTHPISLTFFTIFFSFDSRVFIFIVLGVLFNKPTEQNWTVSRAEFVYHSKHTHKKRKDSLETWAVLLIFSLELEYLECPYRAYIKTAKNGDFCEELLSENDFETVLATFCCYDHGAKASEAVQKIATDQKEYRKCSSCVIICRIAKIYLSINNKLWKKFSFWDTSDIR